MAVLFDALCTGVDAKKNIFWYWTTHDDFHVEYPSPAIVGEEFSSATRIFQKNTGSNLPAHAITMGVVLLPRKFCKKMSGLSNHSSFY